jgi:hypothetical protein
MTKRKQREEIIVDGQDIKSVAAAWSRYCNLDCLNIITSNGMLLRMPTSTVMKMINHFHFTGSKARKYFYLDEAHHHG